MDSKQRHEISRHILFGSGCQRQVAWVSFSWSVPWLTGMPFRAKALQGKWLPAAFWRVKKQPPEEHISLVPFYRYSPNRRNFFWIEPFYSSKTLLMTLGPLPPTWRAKKHRTERSQGRATKELLAKKSRLTGRDRMLNLMFFWECEGIILFLLLALGNFMF